MSTLYFSGIYNGIIFILKYYNHINQHINIYLRFPQGAQLLFITSHCLKNITPEVTL